MVKLFQGVLAELDTLVAALGIGLITGGVHQLYGEAVAAVTCGVILLSLVVLGAMRRRPGPPVT